MAEKGSQRRNDRCIEAKDPVGQRHCGRTLEHIAQQRRRGELLVAGAQHIGGADIAGADAAQILRAGETRENDAERNGAAQIAEDQRGGGGESRRKGERQRHEQSAVHRHAERR